MSGICGVFFKAGCDRVRGEEELAEMVGALGRDGCEQPKAITCGQVGLGLQRRSQDPSSGIVQAIVHGRPVILVMHGALFSGASFATTGERTEEILQEVLARFIKGGIREVHDLRGDYAAVLWDGRTQELSLVTDRFRVHPLFYYEDSEKLVFASRMRSLLACPFAVHRSINPKSLVDVMAFSAITTERTVFKEVKKLPPGHVLTCRDGRVAIRSYWEVDFLDPQLSAEAILKERLQAEFAQAVSARLTADREQKIGAFLSGGIDSSTVTGVLTRLTRAPIKCFSIGFAEQRFNEMEYARIAARHFGVEHHEYYVTPEDTFDAIPTVLNSFDEPFANASAIPTYFCAKLAREHGVDVMYAGDGGDELFAGNERYSSQRIFDYYTRLPKEFRDWIIKPTVTKLADTTGVNLFVLGKKYIRRASIPLPQRLYSYGLFNVIPMGELFDDEVLEGVGGDYDAYSPAYEHYFRAPAVTDLDRQLYIDLKITISDNDVLKVTRMTQAAGVAVRFPFLDHKLVEFAMKVPSSIKMPSRELRVFFKRAYSDVLPREILSKTKHGFGLPIPVWLRTDKRLNDMMHELVLGSTTAQRGMFKRRALEELVDRHRTESGSFYGDILWNVMIWELWLRTFWDRPSA